MAQAEPSPPAAAPRHFSWRRLLQYRLRTLLILTAIIAVGFGWWSHTARRQREAVAALEKAGAFVDYDSSLPWMGGKDDSPQWPKWLLDKGSVDYFARVQWVYLDDSKITDAGLEQLTALTSLQGLLLTNAQVTDVGLEHLKGLTSLRWLVLSNTKVTDSGLEHLKNLTALEVIYLENTQVTDAGVARLQQALPHCKIHRLIGRC